MPHSKEAMKLDRMRELLARLGNPQEALPIVHVAGTKGKGSTAAMIATVLSASGYRTGLFTSPHLDRVEERIAVDRRPCSPDELADLVEQVRPAVEAMDQAAISPLPLGEGTEMRAEQGRVASGQWLVASGQSAVGSKHPSKGGEWRVESGQGEAGLPSALRQSPNLQISNLQISKSPNLQIPQSPNPQIPKSPTSLGPTFFEIVTAMAFDHFRRSGVDVAVLEVGLGGRLDSTNVCSPCVTIITSISFDHTKQLGDTLAAIAAEKAGIIKPGVPVISGVDADEPREVIRRIARQNAAPLVELGVDFRFEYHPPQHLEAGGVAGTIRLPRCKAATSGRGPSRGIRRNPSPRSYIR